MGKRKHLKELERITKKLKKYGVRLDGTLENSENVEHTSQSQVDKVNIAEEDLGAEEQYCPQEHDDHDVDMIQEDGDNEVTEIQDAPLDESVLKILGEDAEKEEKKVKVHKDLANRWTNVIQNGLAKETKEIILKKYLPTDNLNTVAPKINPEVVSAITHQITARDKKLSERQDQLGIVISCLGMALTTILEKSEFSPLIEPVSDAARLLCDLHCQESQVRRALILPGLNKSIKELAEHIKVDEFLFGQNLSEKIKNMKTIEKSSMDLKATPQPIKKLGPQSSRSATMPLQSRTLNYRGPPAYKHTRPIYPVNAGGPRYQNQQTPRPRQPIRQAAPRPSQGRHNNYPSRQYKK